MSAMACAIAGLTLCALVIVRRGWNPWLLPTLVLAVVSPYLAYIDTRWRRLPNRALATAAVFAICALAAAWFSSNDWRPAARALVCGVTAGVVLGAVAIAGSGFGGGDAKLVCLLGLCLGAIGWTYPVAAVLFGFLAAGVWAVGTLATCRARRQRTIPLGPFLTVGAMLVLCFPPM